MDNVTRVTPEDKMLQLVSCDWESLYRYLGDVPGVKYSQRLKEFCELII